ncbi:hypothetical protein FOMG_16305 [Fusarium oxysporum f. sp. melonis 26406]|uniref:Uncharacterized protein n=1 Tax=Fusarium oxysporum f. sp. melonis 26406 TaxID=1089452 RepID=W9Z615_FUSOX|nr:hypothetical protein FOMG_16305 [Fusarium oxysporum f. sp. melonis 26406]
MSTVAQQQGIRRRFPRQYPGLESDIQPVPVNSRYTPPLKNIELLEVAHIFSRLECRILQGSAQVLQNHTLSEDQREPDEQQRLIRLEKADRDLLDVHGGKYQFSVGYLKDRELLREWGFAAAVHRELFRQDPTSNDQENYQIATASAKGLEKLASPLPAALKLAAEKGSLDVLTRNAIGDKYLFLDAIINLLHEKLSTNRQLPTWESISENLKELSSKASVSKVTTTDENIGSKAFSIILWTTFFITVFCSGPMLAYAWNFSDRKPGLWAEEDFFFLLQGCILQVFSLCVSAFSLMRGRTVPVAAWLLPSGFAVVLTIFSPFFYCFVSKWWSSFVVSMAASVQAFLVLQIALYNM